MKTKLILSAICIVSLSSLFVACSDDDNDTTKPVIVINEPTEGGAIKTGSLLHLDMDLSDDVIVLVDERKGRPVRAGEGYRVWYAAGVEFGFGGGKRLSEKVHGTILP